MRQVFSIILFAFAVVSFFFTIKVFFNRNYIKPLHRAFSVTALGSTLWSIGYGAMLIVEDRSLFMTVRAVGISGLFLFILSAQIMIELLVARKDRPRAVFIMEAIGIIAILYVVLRPDSVYVIYSKNGIVTEFTNEIVSIVYTAFTVIVAGIFVAMSISILNKKYLNSIRAFGRNSLIVEGLIMIGMVFDTILPALGTNVNIPGSTLMQFVGLMILYYAMNIVERNRISIQNLTGYIYDTLESPVLVFDRFNTLCIANRAAFAMFGFGREVTLAEVDFWQYVFASDPPEGLDKSQNNLVLDYEAKNRGMICRLYINPIFDQYRDFIGYIVTASDITESVKHTEELERARNEALKANTAKSLFLANMSHEIRTPMNSILGFSELGLKGAVDETSKSYLSDIHDSAENLLTIINDILDFSKIESGKIELVDEEYNTAEVLREVRRVIEIQAKKKGLDFEFDINPFFPGRLYGDRMKFRAILINLLNNAIKYTKEGSVKLSISYMVLGKEEKFRASSYRPAVIRIKVKDTGVGIKKDEIEKIFESFSRVDEATNSKTEGTGLGLSITKGYIELMGGHLGVDSEYGEGTTFAADIVQGIVDPTPVSFEKQETKKPETTFRIENISILAVDDNAVNLKLFSTIMKNYGVEIDTATSGQDSIDMCEKKQYDMIFMDQMMPVMDGIEAMEHIRELGGVYEKGGSSVIVALTADAIEGTKEELLRRGFDEYLAKPIVFSELEHLLSYYTSGVVKR